MKNLTLSLIILNFISFQKLNAQNLEPNNSIFEIYNYQFEYYSKVRTKLFKNLSDNPELRLLVKPSFSPEYIFQIEKDNDKQTYNAILNISTENIWYSKNFNSIIVKEYSSKIKDKDVQLLSNIFLKIIEKTHFPIEDIIGLDGVTYNFSVWKQGKKSGIIWSPNDLTNKTIIDITQKIINQIKDKKQNVYLTKEDRDRLEAILKDLNKLPKIEDYKLALEIKEVIENKREYFSSQLSESHKYQLDVYLFEFEKIILQQIAFNNLDIPFIKNLIDIYQKKFEDYIKFETYKEDSENIEEYIKKNSEDNIFVELKKIN